MPERLTRGWGGFAGGFGEGIAQSANQWGQEARVARGEQRRQQLAMVKDVEDKVASGQLELEQGIGSVANYGSDPEVGGQALGGGQPSVQSQLAKVIGGFDRAGNLNDVPSNAALSATRPTRVQPYTPSNIPDQFRDPNTTEGGLEQLDPQMQSLLDVAQQKRRDLVANIPPTLGQTAYNPTTGAMEREPDSRFNPLTQTKQTFGSPTQTTPTPAQLGASKATEAVGQAQRELAGGLPELQGQGFTRKEAVERPAKVQTAAATTRATTQAGIDVTTAPGNVQKEAAKAATIATTVKKAENDLLEAGVPPNMAQSFLHGTATGGGYVYIDPSTPNELTTVATKPLATSIPPIRLLSKAQNDSVQQVETGRQYLNTMMTAYKDALPTGPGGRLITGPANTLGMLAQTKPQLDPTSQPTYAALIATFPP